MGRAAAIGLLGAVLGFCLGWWGRPVKRIAPPEERLGRSELRRIVRMELAPLLAEIRADLEQRKPVVAYDAPSRAIAAPAASSKEAAPAVPPLPDIRRFEEVVPTASRGFRLPDSVFLLEADAALARYGRPDRTFTAGKAVVWRYEFPTGEMEEQEEVVTCYDLEFLDGRLYQVRGPKRETRTPRNR